LWNEPIVDGLDHLPTNDEILKATSGMKNKAPRESGLTPQMFKALLTDDQIFEVLKMVTLDFWESELTPEQWETGMLKILPKKGDLSRPSNYRGIMLLEVAYKVVVKITEITVAYYQYLNTLTTRHSVVLDQEEVAVMPSLL